MGVACYAAPILVALFTGNQQLAQRKEDAVATINVRPERFVQYVADIALSPFMYALSGVWLSGTWEAAKEKPQRTHRWNNTGLSSDDVVDLDRGKMVHCEGIPNAMRRINPIFHLPILGGWRDYVVLEPEYGWNRQLKWHVGWIAEDGVSGVSRIPIVGPVRMTRGPGAVSFFGVLVGQGTQIVIRRIGTGRIGEGGQWARVPLL